ncbi:MAG TPA: hypothetical protein VL500_04490 [Candidatus Eisenbacteria bacterium]|nr:hypothetical protein [Candidatus Eisenbacteria bacterium]
MREGMERAFNPESEENKEWAVVSQMLEMQAVAGDAKKGDGKEKIGQLLAELRARLEKAEEQYKKW